jgi:hypothetical protein
VSAPPFGLPPVHSRLVGLHVLFVESLLRLRTLQAVSARESFGLLSIQLDRELSVQRQLVERLRVLAVEVGRQEPRP